MNRIFLGFLLSAVVALPGFAQGGAGSKGVAQTPDSQSADASDKQPLPPQTPTDFWDGDDPNLVNLVTHPFASKKYVQRMTRPIKDRLNVSDM